MKYKKKKRKKKQKKKGRKKEKKNNEKKGRKREQEKKKSGRVKESVRKTRELILVISALKIYFSNVNFSSLAKKIKIKIFF